MSAPTVFTNGKISVTTGTSTGTLTEIVGVKEITAPLTRSELADSTMGDTLETFYPGPLSAPISVTTREDYDSSTGTNEKFYDLMNNRTAIRVEVRPVDGTITGTNPRFVWSRVFVTQANAAPSGAWGASVKNSIEFRPGSGCTFARTTST